jgi:hypothetical protein
VQRCHAAVPLGRSLLFFGGGRSDTLSNNLCIYDTETPRWRDGPTTLAGRPPTARQNAQCGIVPGTGVMVVFGGWRLGLMGQDKNLGDTILLDLDFEPGVEGHAGSAAEAEAEDEGESEEEGGGVQEGFLLPELMANLPEGASVVGSTSRDRVLLLTRRG